MRLLDKPHEIIRLSSNLYLTFETCRAGQVKSEELVNCLDFKFDYKEGAPHNEGIVNPIQKFLMPKFTFFSSAEGNTG